MVWMRAVQPNGHRSSIQIILMQCPCTSFARKTAKRKPDWRFQRFRLVYSLAEQDLVVTPSVHIGQDSNIYILGRYLVLPSWRCIINGFLRIHHHELNTQLCLSLLEAGTVDPEVSSHVSIFIDGELDNRNVWHDMLRTYEKLVSYELLADEEHRETISNLREFIASDRPDTTWRNLTEEI